jgi:hypothetical protein
MESAFDRCVRVRHSTTGHMVLFSGLCNWKTEQNMIIKEMVDLVPLKGYNLEEQNKILFFCFIP